MNLDYLLRSTKIKKIVGKTKNVKIDYITVNSREKHKNMLYIAQSGSNVDGHSFVDEAIINGAVALVVEHELPHYKFPQIVVENSRIAVATIASQFYGNPKDKLKFIGITGTNGKTSCALFISQILNSVGYNTATFGTLGIYANGKHEKSNLTTPDPIFFHKTLSKLVKDNIKYIVMEVSAHSIALEKVCNINFEVGILTNITQDHLDYFLNMKNYASTKLKWINSSNVKNAIVNADDALIKNGIERKSNTLFFGLSGKNDIKCFDIVKDVNGSCFNLSLFQKVVKAKINLVGEFNIYNVMAVVGCSHLLGLNLNVIISSLEKLKAPIGRFNVIKLTNNKIVVVDFAHTPDSLEKVLKSAREVCKGELISLFGCGGDRDRTKRAIMGEISENLADFTIITSDNPRFEKPEEILNEIESGMKTHNYLKISDRKIAINKALSMLKPNDIVVISGKGGELYQDINGIKIPYNDFEEVEKFKKFLIDKK